MNQMLIVFFIKKGYWNVRIYWKNGGDMLELVRSQQKVLPLAAGTEEVIYTATDMIRMEKKNKFKLV